MYWVYTGKKEKLKYWKIMELLHIFDSFGALIIYSIEQTCNDLKRMLGNQIIITL